VISITKEGKQYQITLKNHKKPLSSTQRKGTSRSSAYGFLVALAIAFFAVLFKNLQKSKMPQEWKLGIYGVLLFNVGIGCYLIESR
jgi:hypothetical protein